MKETNVRLHATLKSTAREVINLVVQSINRSSINRGRLAHVHSEEHFLDLFLDICLVAVMGARERILRDDYHLLDFRNPWMHGCLYVCMKNDLLPAIKQG